MTRAERLKKTLEENLDLLFEALWIKFAGAPEKRNMWKFLRQGIRGALHLLYEHFLSEPGWGIEKDDLILCLSMLGYYLSSEGKVEEVMSEIESNSDGSISLQGQMQAISKLMEEFRTCPESYARRVKEIYLYLTTPYLKTLEECEFPSSIIPTSEEVAPGILVELYLENKDRILTKSFNVPK